MPYAWDPSSLLGILSGLAVALLGAATLTLKPRRPGPVAFGAFAVLWGVQVVLSHVANAATDTATALVWAHAFTFALIPLSVPLLFFVTRLALGARSRAPWLLVAVTGAGALLLLLVFASFPTTFIAGADVNAAGNPRLLPGPLFDPVGLFSALVAFVVALVVLVRTLRRAGSDTHRAQLTLAVAGFSAFVAYKSAEVLTVTLPGVRQDLAVFQDATFSLWWLSGAVGTLACAVTLVHALRSRDVGWRGLVVACTTVPFAAGILEASFPQAALVGFRTVGLWRLVMVALLAYAIVRYRLFDVEFRLRQTAPAVTYAVVALVSLVAVWNVWGPDFVARPAYGALATVGVLATVAPTHRLGHVAFDRAAPHVTDPHYIYKRKVDVYRAALEDAQTQGMGDHTEEAFLTELRRSLGISEQEHRLLLLFLESEQKFGSTPSRAGSDRFRIERELGRGAFGRALLARDEALHRDVVLKQPLAPWLLEGDARESFLKEARIAASLKHPNVVTVFDVVTTENPPMIVMEYVSGGSLAERLRAKRALPVADAVGLTLDVLAGLDAIHHAGIVHRDLKPGNVLVDGNGAAKVTDFGIAHVPRDVNPAATAVTTRAQPGSLAFMSPEQARGHEVDARSDLYAVGVMLYRMLAGQHYVNLSRASEFEARRLIQQAAPRLPHPGVPGPLEAVLRRALAKDADDRFQDAAEMRAALTRVAPHTAEFEPDYEVTAAATTSMEP